MKSSFDSMDQVNRLREIQALRRLSPHPNIIQLLEVLYDKKTGNLSLVFEVRAAAMSYNILEINTRPITGVIYLFSAWIKMCMK